MPAARFSRRAPHHAFPGFPGTTALYTPTTLYAPPNDMPTTLGETMAGTAAAGAGCGDTTDGEHPTGHYELRGDGVATPYVWVRIRNPPPAQLAAPPASPDEPREGAAASATRSRIYRWTDDAGTTFWTDRPESVPELYRSQAQTERVTAQP